MKWGWSRSDAKTWRFNADWSVVYDGHRWYVVWAGKWLHEDYGSDALAIAAAEAKMIDWKF
jgi:hypothetical protein